MTDSLYLRLKSLNTRTVRGVTSPKNIVRVAAMHNLREIQAELGASAASGINPGRMHLNYQLRGPATADEVAGLAAALLGNAGVTTLRRDACMALELVVSLPAGTAIDHREYFGAAVAWADAFFSVPILSAAVHLDEAAPHLHILLLPLVAGRMQGGALAGGPAKIRAMLADFQQQVAQHFGLAHQPRAKRLSKSNRDAAGRMVLDALRARPERLIEPGMRDALIAALGSQAETLLALMGQAMPATKAKTKSFAAIMTAPCKPERTRRAAPNTKHIDIAQNLGNEDGEKFDNVYALYRRCAFPSPVPAREQPQQPAMASAADQHASRTDFVRLVEQREPATGDVQQQDGQGLQKILDTPPADQSQPPSSATPAPCALVQAVSLAQAGTGKISETPASADARKPAHISPPTRDAAGHADQPEEIRRIGAGAEPLGLSSENRTKHDQIPAQPEIVENTETGATSLPTTAPANGGSLRSAWPCRPPMVGRGFQRQRGGGHRAASDWGSPWVCRLEHGAEHPATGPPPAHGTCTLTKHAGPAAAPGTKPERQHHETEIEQRRLGRRQGWQTRVRAQQRP